MELAAFSKEFYFIARLEEASRRIWVTDYDAGGTGGYSALSRHLIDMALRKNAEKIIFPVKTEDEKQMAASGFHVEGIIPGYFKGTDAFFMAAFPSPRRAASPSLETEKQMLRDIMRTPERRTSGSGDGFILRMADENDAAPIAGLLRKVFASYPSPVFEPEYIIRSMKKGNVYMAACHGHRIVAVVSAEIHRDQCRAELADCATDPSYRGRGLNTFLLNRAEQECLTRGITCLYSLARASSYGMNLVLRRRGYLYCGTLVNNCHIDGGFENMNIWFKNRTRTELNFFYRQCANFLFNKRLFDKEEIK